MTALPTAPVPTASAPAYCAQTLDVRLRGDDPDGLIRVLGVLRRRGCRLTRVDYQAAQRPLHLIVELEVPVTRAGRMAAWVANLVDVESASPR